MKRSLIYSLLALLLLSLSYLFYPVVISTDEPLLIINMWDLEKLPKNFRMTSSPIPSDLRTPSLKGLKDLKASGSGQFSEKSLDLLITKIPSRAVTIVDLREESHGFLNGIAVSWYGKKNWVNKEKTIQEIQADEKSRLQACLKNSITFLYANKKFPIPFWIHQAITENELAILKGLGYIRIPITDHMKPSNQAVDQFINFINALPKNSLWLHFHCAAGEGRTTTFMIMYDMIRNAKEVSFEDILTRQSFIGGLNLLNESSNSDWRKPHFEERKDFLKKFYKYCQLDLFGQKTWSDWIKEQKMSQATK